MGRSEGFVYKSPEQLDRQVKDVGKALGVSILPASRREEVNTESAEDLKGEYPRRYGVYVDTLRRLRGGKTDVEGDSRTRIFVLNALDSYIAGHYSGKRERTLRGYQLSVFEGLKGFLERGNEEGYIKLPSGSGKTVLFVEFVEATKLRTLIVVPTKLLVDQTAERFRQFAKGVETGKVYGDQKDYDRQVTIITYASFIKNIHEGNIDPKDYELLILDEAHKALGRRRFSLIRMFDRAIKLGFTATPKYSEDKQLKNLLPEEIHNMGLREAVELGVVSPLSVYIARTEIDLTSDIRVTSLGDYDQKDLERKVNITRRNLAAVELYRRMFSGRPAIAYCVGIKHAMDLAGFFISQGIKADSISGEDSRELQQAKIKLFKEGAVKVLCNADILIEGFDEPAVEVCLNLRPTLSPVIAEQRAGRVLRPDSKNPDKMAYIVDFIDGDVIGGKRVPISFAQIIEAAQIFRKTLTSGEGESQREGVSHYPDLRIEGLKVVTEAEEVLRLARQMEGRSEAGWLSCAALSRRFNLSVKAVTDIVYSLRGEYATQITIPVDGDSKVGYVSPEFAERFGEIVNSLKKPEGWVTYSYVADELKRAKATIIERADNYREAHPEWFKVYKTKWGWFSEHYSPELVAALREGLGVRQSVPEGWLTRGVLARKIGRSFKYLKRFEEQYREAHPEWFRQYEAKKGGFIEHFSPELVEIIQNSVKTEPGEQWLTTAGLARLLHRKESYLKKVAEGLSREHPEWVRVRKIRNGVRRWYAPELVQKLTETINVYEKPPKGWFSAGTIAQMFGRIKGRDFVVRRARRYRESNPDWFREVNGRRGLVLLYSSQLVEALTRDYEKEKRPPEGWIRRAVLWKEIGCSYRTAKKIMSFYRETHPEWFSQFLSMNGGMSDYCSPELITEIKERWHRGEYTP